MASLSSAGVTWTSGSGFAEPILSSLRNGASKSARKPRPLMKVTLGGRGGESDIVDTLKFMPEASKGHENGWQMKCEGVQARIAQLFNCYTMSDMMFQVDSYTIPAHKFVLASASPVFFRQLFEDETGDRLELRTLASESSGTEFWNTCAVGTRIVSIKDVPHVAFFEFLQYIYTDNVNITLDNVLPLIFLADTYKVAGLSDKCLAFIRSEVTPTSVLRVIHILRCLMLKACTTLWHEVVEQGKARRKFRELGLAERRTKLEEQFETCSMGSSRASRRSTGTFGMSVGRRSTIRSKASSGGGRSTLGIYRDTDVESLMGDGDFGDVALDMAEGFTHKAFKEKSFRGQLMEAKIAPFIEELLRKCWKCVQEETAAVISSADMWDQDVKMLRQILRLDTCNVPEISLFRAISDWARRKCKAVGTPPTAENQRQVLGTETMLLIRFPAMTAEQFQWEVVPTGLLEYDDVQQLLYVMKQRGVPLGRYNGKPRYNISIQKEALNSSRPGTSSTNADTPSGQLVLHKEAMKTVYNAAPDCHLDSMLASEMLRNFLKGKAESDDVNAGLTISEMEISSASQGISRLPPITTPSLQSLARSTRQGVTTPRAFLSSSQMVLGQRLDEEMVEGVLLKGGGRVSHPEDFVRICEGLYIFRGTSLVELWIEDGEIMAKDHGPNVRLQDTELVDASPSTARRVLGLAQDPPRGRGLPLPAFLCRQ